MLVARMSMTAAAAALLAGCSTLPVSGPTGRAVTQAGRDAQAGLPFRIVQVVDASALPPPPVKPPMETPALPPGPTDMIGAGDLLDITIYEAGVTLFSDSISRSLNTGGAGGPSVGGAMAGGGAQATRLPSQRVDDLGYIRVPYAGRLHAGGHTPEGLGTMIRNALRGMSQNPQVVVVIQQSITNSVIVGGEINRPGRLTLSTNRETLADTVALAGGFRGEAKDVVVRVTRDNRDREYRLSDVLSAVARDMRVVPGDRIELMRRPLTYSVLGASGRVAQIGFPDADMSLVEAVSLAGGVQPASGDASAIFLFRFEPKPDGTATPVVYHLNMMNPGSYFLAQRMAMRDKDVIYFGNAESNQPAKLIELVSRLFSPIAVVSGVLYNSGL
jgi:polysaccharide export outer membrane protein